MYIRNFLTYSSRQVLINGGYIEANIKDQY